MIGAQTDQTVQEHLIEKYMLLPNQVWDSIIQQATKVSFTTFFQSSKGIQEDRAIYRSSEFSAFDLHMLFIKVFCAFVH